MNEDNMRVEVLGHCDEETQGIERAIRKHVKRGIGEHVRILLRQRADGRYEGSAIRLTGGIVGSREAKYEPDIMAEVRSALDHFGCSE